MKSNDNELRKEHIASIREKKNNRWKTSIILCTMDIKIGNS